MDLSVFFRNKRVFWTWIITPLLIRIICVVVMAAATQAPRTAFLTEQAMFSTIKNYEHAIEQADKQLSRFEPASGLSYKEIFLTDFAELFFETGITGKTQTEESTEKTPAGIEKYTFYVSGSAPSMHAISRFLDKAFRLDYLTLQKGSIVEHLHFHGNCWFDRNSIRLWNRKENFRITDRFKPDHTIRRIQN